jgi:tripartite-type tricarboxylate transporter receptor subunit TctC
MRATQFMFAQAPRDGTYLGVVNNGIPLEQLVTGPSVRFDVRKFNWVGSAGLSNLLTMAWHTSGAKTIEDVKTREVIAGATGVSSNGFLYANVMNVLLGAKFKIVAGYGTSAEADLAMERGEVSARAGFSLSAVQLEHPDWIRDKKVNVLFQTGLKREASLPDVPLMHELAKTDEHREALMLLSASVGLGRPFFLPPDVPADRVAAMRRAFDATLADPEFLKEAELTNLDIRYMSGVRLSDLVNSIVDAPDAVAEKVRSAYGREAGAPP